MAKPTNDPSQQVVRRPFMEIALEAFATTESARPEFVAALAEFQGKTAQVRVVDEAEFEFTVKGDHLVITEGFRSEAPDATLVLPAKTIVDMIEGRQTPAEAFFSGSLKVAARTDELVALHQALVILSQEAIVSDRVRELYEEFRTSRFGPRSKPEPLRSDRAAVAS